MLLNLREVVIQGRVRLKTEVQTLLRHLVECWNDTVRSELAATVPSRQPLRGLVRPLQSQGPPGAGAEDRGEHLQLRTFDGPRYGLTRRTEPPLVQRLPMMTRKQYQRD